MYGLSYSHKSNGANFSQIKSSIQSNKPVYAAIFDTSDGKGHSVVIAGFKNTNDAYYYKLMDPNKNSYVLIKLSSSGATSFTYSTGSYKYTTWRCYMT